MSATVSSAAAQAATPVVPATARRRRRAVTRARARAAPAGLVRRGRRGPVGERGQGLFEIVFEGVGHDPS
ncbi:hypothetical protein ACEZDB_33545 [Streptacidiphilus sp. N1-3]|uniref:Uncharacterized protein n=1 Tax=Streptacidiphilus alkalitolerans TaxID=3342712 RepID=A0ABV6XBC0_9ACTN